MTATSCNALANGVAHQVTYMKRLEGVRVGILYHYLLILILFILAIGGVRYNLFYFVEKELGR